MRSDLRSDTVRRGWNTALQSIVRCLPDLAEKLGLNSHGREALAAVGVMADAMVIPLKIRNLRNRALARRYGVSVRTITNWRREGCPFHRGQGAVLKWVAARRYAPVGMEQKFEDRLSRLRFRKWNAQIQEGLSEMRALKLLRRHYGVAPDSADKRLRCPKGGMANPKVLALKRRIDSECAQENFVHL